MRMLGIRRARFPGSPVAGSIKMKYSRSRCSPDCGVGTALKAVAAGAARFVQTLDSIR